jgi:hypothetical protein
MFYARTLQRSRKKASQVASDFKFTFTFFAGTSHCSWMGENASQVTCDFKAAFASSSSRSTDKATQFRFD